MIGYTCCYHVLNILLPPCPSELKVKLFIVYTLCALCGVEYRDGQGMNHPFLGALTKYILAFFIPDKLVQVFLPAILRISVMVLCLYDLT